VWQAEDATFKITLGFIDGMLEVKVFGLNEMLPSLLSKILSEVISFVSTNDSKYEVSNMLIVWITFYYYF
jgi:hypothetical protein